MTPALAMLYSSVQTQLSGMSAEAFASVVSEKGFEVVPLSHRGALVGAVMLRGNEIHVGYAGTPRASIRGHIRETLGRVIAEYGYAVTKIPESMQNSIRFCTRLGFREVARVDGVLHMRCEKSDYL